MEISLGLVNYIITNKSGSSPLSSLAICDIYIDLQVFGEGNHISTLESVQIISFVWGIRMDRAVTSIQFFCCKRLIA